MLSKLIVLTFPLLSLVAPLAGTAIAAATDQVDAVVVFTNDRDAFHNTLSLVIDAQGTVTGARYVIHDGDGSAEVKNFSLAQLKSSGGAILEQQQNVQALTVRGQIDQAAGTGPLVFRYVQNGLSGVYKECQAGLKRVGNDWGITTTSGEPVVTAKIVTWSLGIDTISGICP